MNFELLSSILTTVGDILIGYSVIRVHSKVVHEHKIDDIVLTTMRKEKWWAITGILLIIAGFLVKWYL